MPFREVKGLRFFQFNVFSDKNVTHGIFTRHGGVSPGPWRSLNLGGTVGDVPQRVQENKERLLEALDRSPDTLFEIWQVHQAKVLRADQPRPASQQIPKADAVITHNPGVTLLMRFADCVPIYLYDPQNKAIGLAHAGWKGTIKHIASKTVKEMVRHYGTDPGRLLVGIGPSIGPDHYEIGPDVINKVRKSYPDLHDTLLVAEDDKIKLDLWKANQADLESTGVREIEVARLCTACQIEDWYSHRAENGKTGRFGAIYSLKKVE